MKLFAIDVVEIKAAWTHPQKHLGESYLIRKSVENNNALSQDHMFRIDPSKVEDGKGKSPYDPRHNAASVLVGKLWI